MEKVDISVIMPVYNGQKYLGETLGNLLKQTYKNFEVLCINDASTDATLNIMKKFQKVDKRIRIFENYEHAGAAFSRNRGILEAAGEYITFLDGDDIFEEEMLDDRRIMIYARNHSEVTRISYNRNPMCAYQAMLKLGRELVNRGLFAELCNHYYCLLFFSIRYALVNAKSTEKAKQFYDFWQKRV